MNRLADIRRKFAEDLRSGLGLHCDRVIEAFAEVPRERFVRLEAPALSGARVSELQARRMQV